VVRPCGQRKAPTDPLPTFGPSQRLDIEAEVGFIVGTPSALGDAVPIGAFAEHVFGVCLLNDWSARDLQSWEYVPLGPFLGKSFLTSISPWVVPLAALDQARVTPPARDPQPLPYLRDTEHPWGLDITLQVRLSGPEKDQRGSLIELSWGGAEPIALADGSTRTFLEDGDVVTITATAPGPDGSPIGFGEVTGGIAPAR